MFQETAFYKGRPKFLSRNLLLNTDRAIKAAGIRFQEVYPARPFINQVITVCPV